MKNSLRYLAININALGRSPRGLNHLLFACTVLLAFAAAPLHAQSFQNLYNFDCNTGGCYPYDYGYLTQGSDANLYGTTTGPGGASAGTIFMVTTSSPAVYTDLYKFDGGVNGGTPYAGLTLASDGNFYGTTYAGGTSGEGEVFRFNPSSKSLTVLHSFKGGTDGAVPSVAPIEGLSGYLYGLTGDGYPYRITLKTGAYKSLSSLPIGGIGGPLFLASDHNLYGTSNNGGANGLGTVFRMSTAGTFTTLYSFTGVGTDGARPFGPLTQGSDGNLYGTTTSGGSNGEGIVFKSSLSGTVKTVYSFNSATDGYGSIAGVLAAADGFFYGSNPYGNGTTAYGTVFQASKIGFFSPLFDFTGISGSVLGSTPTSTLMAHTNGTFYGTTEVGGAANGTVFGEGTIYGVTPSTPFHTLIIEGPIFVLPEVKVTILSNNLDGVMTVAFGGVQAQFQPGSSNYLTATVPMGALDGFVTATFPSGLQIQSQSSMHILPLITSLDPTSGRVGTQVDIVGGGLVGATRVTFGGVKATNFTVLSTTLIQATVPTGAKTGKVTVTTPNGTAVSTQTFTVTPD